MIALSTRLAKFTEMRKSAVVIFILNQEFLFVVFKKIHRVKRVML